MIAHIRQAVMDSTYATAAHVMNSDILMQMLIEYAHSWEHVQSIGGRGGGKKEECK